MKKVQKTAIPNTVTGLTMDGLDMTSIRTPSGEKTEKYSCESLRFPSCDEFLTTG